MFASSYCIVLVVGLRIRLLQPNECPRMTINYIQWWGSDTGNLGSVELPLHCYYSLVYSDRVLVLAWVSSLGQIDLFEIIFKMIWNYFDILANLVKRLLAIEIKSVAQIHILQEAVYVSFQANICEKDMNPYLPSYGKTVRQNKFSSLGKATNLREGQLSTVLCRKINLMSQQNTKGLPV